MSECDSLCVYFFIYSLSACLLSLWGRRNNWVFGVAGLAIPIVFAALRYPVGTDFWTYIQIWHGDASKSYMDIFEHFYSEPGFHLISKLTGDYGDERWYFGAWASLTLIPAICSFKKQYRGHYLGIFALLFLLTTFTTSFNIIRQGIAVAFTFVASEYIFKRDFRKFALWIIVAMMFHFSAIIFAPAYFLYSKGELITPKRVFFLLTVFVGVLYATSLVESLSSVSGFEKYSVYAEADSRAQNRSLILSAILVVIFSFRRKYMAELDDRTYTYIILVLVGFLIETTGSITPFIKRSALYFSIYNLVLACIWIKSFYRDRSLATIFILGFFVARFIIAFYILGQANIIPYNTKETYTEQYSYE